MKQPHRRAASLVELIVVMTACASILSTSAVLLHRVMHAQGKTRAFLSAQRSALRLADQFRRDVHQATAVLESDPESDVVLRLRQTESQAVEYQYAAGIVLRRIISGDETVSREEFAFPAESKLVVRQEESPRHVVLSLTNDPSQSEDALSETLPDGEDRHEAPPPLKTFAVPVQLLVSATLGRDARYKDAPPGETNP